jgi:hypothetical protein
MKLIEKFPDLPFHLLMKRLYPSEIVAKEPSQKKMLENALNRLREHQQEKNENATTTTNDSVEKNQSNQSPTTTTMTLGDIYSVHSMESISLHQKRLKLYNKKKDQYEQFIVAAGPYESSFTNFVTSSKTPFHLTASSQILLTEMLME